jgi:hypothetical protein
MTDQPAPEGQLDVQRWLGRCMLRLQQYERAKRKGAQGPEDPHTTLTGTDWEQTGRFALFSALSALRELT